MKSVHGTPCDFVHCVLFHLDIVAVCGALFLPRLTLATSMFKFAKRTQLQAKGKKCLSNA